MSLMRRRDLLQRSASALLATSLAQAGPLARANSNDSNGIDLIKLSVQLTEEGMLLSHDLRIALPDDLALALGKGIAVVFVAEAVLSRKRWYWTDESLARATRRWRLAYQPLTRQWRLSQDNLSRHFQRMSDALDAIRYAERWRIAELVSDKDVSDLYVDFEFKLDTSELPRPLQISVSGQADWKMGVKRRITIPPVD